MAEGYQKINAAFRLYVILRDAVSIPNAPNQLAAWTYAFGLGNITGRDQKIQIAYGMKLFYDELDDMLAYLREEGHPVQNYDHLMRLIEHSITPEGIVHQWQDPRSRLEQAAPILLMLSGFLPDFETVIPEVDLAGVRTDLEQLEKSLEDKDISPVIRHYIRNQINVIRQALWEYKIRGVQVFAEARIKAYVLAKAPEVEAHKDEPEVKKVNQLWQNLSKIMDAAIKIKNFLEAGAKILQLGQGEWHKFHK
jgi:hypothetical protein